jgi:DNA-binding response OmpR family regulator
MLRLAFTHVDQPRRVLIVDRRAENRVVHTTFLRHHGLVARGVAYPDTAMRLLRAFRPEVIVTDLDISYRHLDGLAFISAVRQRHDIRQPAVVVMSDFTHQADVWRARCVGADSFLVKPCPAERLLLEVRQAFYARLLAEVTFKGRSSLFGSAAKH